MKQIEKDMLAAIHATRQFKQANTEVEFVTASHVLVRLHGHIIAERAAAGWRWNLCGWNTPTTRSRINALGAGVSCKAGKPHIMGRAVPENGWFTTRVEVAACTD